MAASEWLRTFLSVYRVGSVTDGARQRGLSQPAASQHLGALERAVGGPLFVRSAGGVTPTALGRQLYSDVAGGLDQLEPLLRQLDGAPPPSGPAPLRVATTVEYFSARVLPLLGGLGIPVTAAFVDPTGALGLLQRGEADVALVPSLPPRRHVVSTPLSPESYALVTGRHDDRGGLPQTVGDLGPWLRGRPWVASSHELPVTRRFWQEFAGRPFDAEVRLTAPDLRVAAAAVEAGLGASLLPTFVVVDGLARGALSEVVDVTASVPAARWFACVLEPAADRPVIRRFVDAVGAPQPAVGRSGRRPGTPAR